MRLRGKPLDQVTLQDVLALVDGEVQESSALDYKLTLPEFSDAGKKELVADVTSLANTTGGVLVYGMRTRRSPTGADTGVAAAVEGVAVENVDALKQRLIALLRDGSEPPLTQQIACCAVATSAPGTFVVLVGVSQSLNRPHRVATGGSRRFWRRSSVGKYEPGISELQRMFLESSSWVEECEAFRANRVEFIQRSPIHNTAAFVLTHVLPIGRLASRLPLKDLEAMLRTNNRPLGDGGYSCRFNADGFLTFSQDTSGAVEQHSQVFRFGGSEGYGSSWVNFEGQGAQKVKSFFAQEACETIERYVRNATVLMSEHLAVDPPYCVLITVKGVQNAQIPTPRTLGVRRTFDRDQIALPAVVLESVDEDSAELASALDILWQCAGWAGRPKQL